MVGKQDHGGEEAEVNGHDRWRKFRILRVVHCELALTFIALTNAVPPPR